MKKRLRRSRAGAFAHVGVLLLALVADLTAQDPGARAAGRPVNYYPDENVTYKFASGGMLSTAEIRTDDGGRPYVNHCGSVKGYNACLILYVDDALVVAVLENGGRAGPAIREALVFTDFFRTTQPHE